MCTYINKVGSMFHRIPQQIDEHLHDPYLFPRGGKLPDPRERRLPRLIIYGG